MSRPLLNQRLNPPSAVDPALFVSSTSDRKSTPMRRERLSLTVRRVCQTASGGSYVVIYDAEVDFIDGATQVEVDVAGITPADSDPSDVEAARQAIQRGATSVFRAVDAGAHIRIKRLVLHPVDFKLWAFEKFTEDELRRALGSSA